MGMNTGRRVKPRHEALSRLRRHFTAAVRFRDGSRDLYRIKNADDIHDARKVALDNLSDVHSLLIAEHLSDPEDHE